MEPANVLLDNARVTNAIASVATHVKVIDAKTSYHFLIHASAETILLTNDLATLFHFKAGQIELFLKSQSILVVLMPYCRSLFIGIL